MLSIIEIRLFQYISVALF